MAYEHPVYINTIDFFIYTSELKSCLNVIYIYHLHIQNILIGNMDRV